MYYFTAVRILPFFRTAKDSFANAKYRITNKLGETIHGKSLRGYWKYQMKCGVIYGYPVWGGGTGGDVLASIVGIWGSGSTKMCVATLLLLWLAKSLVKTQKVLYLWCCQKVAFPRGFIPGFRQKQAFSVTSIRWGREFSFLHFPEKLAGTVISWGCFEVHHA